LLFEPSNNQSKKFLECVTPRLTANEGARVLAEFRRTHDDYAEGENEQPPFELEMVEGALMVATGSSLLILFAQWNLPLDAQSSVRQMLGEAPCILTLYHRILTTAHKLLTRRNQIICKTACMQHPKVHFVCYDQAFVTQGDMCCACRPLGRGAAKCDQESDQRFTDAAQKHHACQPGGAAQSEAAVGGVGE